MDILQTLPPLTGASSRNAYIVLERSLEMDNAQADLFQRIEPGDPVRLPSNYVGEVGDKPFPVVVPSLEVVTPRGHEARLVSLHETNPNLQKLYEQTVKARKGVKERLLDMVDEAVVRILDTSGASGLHHIHRTRFPNTVFYIAKRGNGLQPNVYLTEMGRIEGNIPVIAMVTATKDKKGEYDLFKLLGAGDQKGRYTH